MWTSQMKTLGTINNLRIEKSEANKTINNKNEVNTRLGGSEKKNNNRKANERINQMKTNQQ